MRASARRRYAPGSRRIGGSPKPAPPDRRGNPYGDAAGHSCIAISGPVERSITLETGRNDRVDNMWAFSEAALQLLIDCLTAARG